MDLGNEAFLAASRARKEGIPDWRRVGRDFRRAPRESWGDRSELTVPYLRTLRAAKNASFLTF